MTVSISNKVKEHDLFLGYRARMTRPAKNDASTYVSEGLCPSGALVPFKGFGQPPAREGFNRAGAVSGHEDEPSFGSVATHEFVSQGAWAQGRDNDAEDEHDGREPDDDSEPALGSFDRMMNQAKSWRGAEILASSTLTIRPGRWPWCFVAQPTNVYSTTHPAGIAIVAF